MTREVLLKLILFLFCAVTLLDLLFGRSFSTAISKSLFVCLMASGWGMGIWLLYSKIASSVQRTAERKTETEEDLNDGASSDR